MKEVRLFFFEKKPRKTFMTLRRGRWQRAGKWHQPVDQTFFTAARGGLLFSKKQVLLPFSPTRLPFCSSFMGRGWVGLGMICAVEHVMEG
jgi:hypothetical protein